MALIDVQLTFPDLNVSIQIGDTVYYTNYTNYSFADYTLLEGISSITEMGYVSAVSNNSITVKMSDALAGPTGTSYVMFSKDNTANMSSILGYYGQVKFKNNSRDKAELYATACEISESSK